MSGRVTTGEMLSNLQLMLRVLLTTREMVRDRGYALNDNMTPEQIKDALAERTRSTLYR